MKTFSVKEVAEALDMTPRGVIQRLNRGQLKGNKKLNQFGVAEWQVYANREILMAMEAKKTTTDGPINDQSFAPGDDDTIDAEDIEVSGDYTADGPSKWRDVEIARLEVLAEKLVKPLAERLEFQAAELREKEKLLEEKERQLRLLPDLEKRAEDERRAAEEERKAAEIRALEVEALKKQISALEEVKQESESKLLALEEERRATEQAQFKVQELEKAMTELRENDEANRRAAEEELERIKAEKEAEAQAVRGQLDSLTSQLEELQKPWWKKWFLPASTSGDKS